MVVPTLNEEAALSRNLGAVLEPADQVVVSDGGSIDGTRELCRQLGAPIVSGPAGRGRQLNRGAAALSTDVLIFLHADTTLPPRAFQAVRAAIAAGRIGGGFHLRFDSDRTILRLGAWLINRRTDLTRAPLGDQAQFATRSAFDALHGFRDWPILEDLDFIRRLRRAGQISVLEPRVTTSARRFLERGILRTVATNWLIWALYFGGVAPERLARLYQHVR